MNNTQLEQWVLKTLEIIEVGGRSEDDRVEIKRIWPEDIYRTARQIAGHANAAHGENLLWIVGVDEKEGVIGIDFKELSTWWQQIKSKFLHIYPSLQYLNIYKADKSIAALLFDTSRPPYLVKNPNFNNKQGAIESEIPWREGNSTRTANRSDLLKMLSPIVNLPKYEILSGRLDLFFNPSEEKSNKYAWSLELNCYVEPEGENHITIPFHRSIISIDVSENSTPVVFEGIIISPPHSVDFEVGEWHKYHSPLINSTPAEIHILGPGIISLKCNKVTEVIDVETFVDAQIRITLPLSNFDRPITISQRFPFDSFDSLEDDSWVRHWDYKPFEHVLEISNP